MNKTILVSTELNELTYPYKNFQNSQEVFWVVTLHAFPKYDKLTAS
jgi:hypothetical protein